MKTGPDGVLTIAQYEEQERQRKISYCATINRTCETCNRVGCLYHSQHEQAIKEELKNYEG